MYGAYIKELFSFGTSSNVINISGNPSPKAVMFCCVYTPILNLDFQLSF